MATLPTYEYAGAQYADLPKISTAPQQAAASGWSVLGQQLDKMANYFYGEAASEAQKAGARYAVENPITKEQVDTALSKGQPVQVKGGGRIFQESYLKTQATMLANELQVEGQKKFASIAAAIEAGATLDMASVQAGMKDMIDGYASTVRNLDPEVSVRLRASLTTTGASIHAKALERAVKVQMASYDTTLDEGVLASRPLIETIVSKAGSLDPTTGKEINIDQLIEIEKQPYYDAIKIVGHNKHITEINNIVREAKIKAVASALKDRTVYSSASAALDAIDKKNVGKYTSLFNSLPAADQEKIQEGVLKHFANIEQARNIEKAQLNDANKVLGIEARDMFYRKQITAPELIKRLKALGQITPEELKTLHTEQVGASPEFVGRLEMMVFRNQIGQEDLEQYAKAGKISWKQMNELSKSLRNRETDMGKAAQYINSALGVPDPLTPGFKDERKRAADVRRDLLLEEAAAQQEGKAFNPIARAQVLVEKRLSQSDVTMQKEYRAALRRTLENNKLVYSEDYTDEQLQRAGIRDRTTRARILGQIREIKGEK